MCVGPHYFELLLSARTTGQSFVKRFQFRTGPLRDVCVCVISFGLELF